MNVENAYKAIPLAAIVIDPNSNARSSLDGNRLSKVDADGRTEGDHAASTVEELIRSITLEGQLSPVEVRPIATDRYALTFGFRRYEALRLMAERGIFPRNAEDEWLKNPAINALVVATSDAGAFLRNITENIARKDLTTHDLARACARLQSAYGLSQDAVGDKLNLSRSHTGNLIRVINKLHPKIAEQWAKENPVCRVDTLVGWVAEEQDRQLELFLAASGIKADKSDKDSDDDDGDGDGGKVAKKKRGGSRPSADVIALAIGAVRASNMSKEYKAGCIAGLQFAGGETPRLGNFFDPVEAVKKERNEKFRINAEKKADELLKKAEELRVKAKTGKAPERTVTVKV